MCLLCPSSAARSAPETFCADHEKEWENSPEHLRVEWFRKAKDKRLPAIRQTALADFVDRTLKERANGTPPEKT